MASGQSRSTRDLAPALSRGIRILELMAASPRAWTMSEIAQELKIPKSSAFGLCSTLVRADLLEKQADGTYRLGLRLVDLASARLRSSDLPSEFYAAWDSLDVFRQEAAVLSVRDGVDAIYVACRNSSLPLGITFRIGMRLPASCTATGKAMLSSLPDAEVRALYEGRRLERPTQHSVASVRALLQQLAEVRKRGYSVDDGETREHMCSFGAPVFDDTSECAIAGVAISFLKADITREKATQAARVIVEFAARLSRMLGARRSIGRMDSQSRLDARTS